MAESTSRTETTHQLTTRKLTTLQKIVIAAVLIGLAALAGAMIWITTLGDEPPIRVRNGSMDIELAQGTWQDTGDAHSPSSGKNSGKFHVKVVSANGHTCASGATASGKAFSIFYSDGVEITLKYGGFGRRRSQFRPKDKLTTAGGAHLQYGTPADTGYIKKIETKGGGTPWSCEFNGRADLSVINICTASQPACQ